MKSKLKLFVLFFMSMTLLFACGKEDEPTPKPEYDKLAISKSKLEIEVGKVENVKITAGSGNYEAKSSNESVASVLLADKLLIIKAVAEGTAKITVKDTKTEEVRTIDVIVNVKIPDLAISKDKITIEQGGTETVEVTAGSGKYEVSSSDESKATVKRDGKVITIKAVAEGTAKIVVKDTKTEQIKEVSVTVKKAKYNPQDKVFVKGGTFLMGSPDGEGFDWEHPQHAVELSDFYIAKYEVTNAQYVEFLNEKGNQTEGGEQWLKINSKLCQIEKTADGFRVKDGKDNYPVIYVTWYGAKAYAEWAGGRLPTEAEWEYAARGGQESKGYTYAGSNNPDEVAWTADNSKNPDNDLINGKGTFEVGKKKPNELGLYDMTGNVFEWCSDWYGDYSAKEEVVKNPQGPAEGQWRIQRGSCFIAFPEQSYIAYRGSMKPQQAFQFSGFRVAF